MTLRLEYIATNGIGLRPALAGPEDGEPVILLHGFPDGSRIIAPVSLSPFLFFKIPQIDGLCFPHLVEEAPDLGRRTDRRR